MVKQTHNINMDTVKSTCCPICGSNGEIVAHCEETLRGMLEDIPGFTYARFKCPKCGFKCSSELGDEYDPLGDRIKELEEIMLSIKYTREDFRTSEKLKTYGTLLLKKMGSYNYSLEEVQEWLEKAKLPENLIYETN